MNIKKVIGVFVMGCITAAIIFAVYSVFTMTTNKERSPLPDQDSMNTVFITPEKPSPEE